MAGWIDGVSGGCPDSGYRKIKVDGRDYKASRLAWLYMTGAWPISEIDHVNGDRVDDRFCNLREAMPVQNSQNIRGGRNAAGLRGIKWDAPTGKWVAQISLYGKKPILGTSRLPARRTTPIARPRRSILAILHGRTPLILLALSTTSVRSIARRRRNSPPSSISTRHMRPPSGTHSASFPPAPRWRRRFPRWSQQ